MKCQTLFSEKKEKETNKKKVIIKMSPADFFHTSWLQGLAYDANCLPWR